MCPVYWLLLLCLEAPLLRPLFLYPASASQLCVGGCSFVREAVGILSSPVIISEEMHIMVVWQQHSEVTKSQLSAQEPSWVHVLFLPLLFMLQYLGDGWRRSRVGRALYDFCLW